MPADDPDTDTDGEAGHDGDVDTALEPEADVAPTVEAGPRKLSLVAATGVMVLGLDQLTKHWALQALQDQRTIDVVGSLRFNLFFNTGAAFSMASGKGIGPWISVLAIVVVVALAMGYTSRFRLGAVAAGLIAGGAVGNLTDRALRGDQGFLHGAVIDFIDLQWWPVFNVADSAISVGAVLLVLVSIRTPSP